MSKLNLRNANLDLVADCYDEGVSLKGAYDDEADYMLYYYDNDDYLDYLEKKWEYTPIEEVPRYVREALGWGEYAAAERAEWDRIKSVANGYRRWAEVMVA
jgi:hypothetical protein